ncbi:MAG: enoyl-CoA hydratase/isomerase family protein [Deltaproteobacteria bacterium]|nr:enoyl-CoA hydratase/isomerase family protein [Deltaproteobacteria bacterium]MBW2396172.1 enoyl-CoA hydratase/isomerase family protein [Deltaproteobacteria bacterium]
MSAVLYEKRGHVAWVTLNRPEAKNLLNGDMFIGLIDAWQEVRADDEVRVAVLTAAGEVDFCCGGDLGSVIPLWTGAREPENGIERRIKEDVGIVGRVMLKDEIFPKPVVGAINGRALGGGCEITLATDVRVAAEHATFGLPEPRSGVVPGAGTMARLARQIPYAHAMKLLLTAQPVSAQEALAMGLISEVVPATQLQARAEELAQSIAGNAPLAMRAIKQTVLESHTLSWDAAFRVEMREAGKVMASRDAREGPRAFKEKRKPVFTGE